MEVFRFDFYEILVWVSTIIMFIVALVCRQFPLKSRGGLNQPLPNPLAVLLPIIFFTLMAALRKNIGDTYFYQHSFELMGDNNGVTFQLFFSSMFSFFQNSIRNMTDNPQWLIAFSAVFSIPAPLIILYKYSHPFELSIFLFVAFGYFGGMMNGMRQYMAAAILICGTKYLFSVKKSSFFKYAVFVLLAYCMHSSAIIMLPLYFIVRRRAWQMSSYIVFLGSIIGVVFFDKLMPSFLSALGTTSYATYSENGWFTDGQERGMNLFRALVSLVPIILAYINKQRMSRLGHIGDILINVAFINASIYMLSLYNWIFARLAIYLSVYFIILVGWIVYNGVKQRDRDVYYIALIILFFIYSRYAGYMISSYESDYFFPGRKLF